MCAFNKVAIVAVNLSANIFLAGFFLALTFIDKNAIAGVLICKINPG